MNTNEVPAELAHHTRIGAWHYEGRPSGWEMFVVFATEAERDAFIARFPKSANVKPSRFYTQFGTFPVAMAGGNLKPDDVNKGVNETGLRRFRRVVKVIGDEIKWGSQYANKYESIEAFEGAIR